MNHKPKQEPIIAPQKLQSHLCFYVFNLQIFRKNNVTSNITNKRKHVATKITGTVASPSKPSVKLTALDALQLQTLRKNKNQLKFINKSLKMESKDM